MRDISLLRAQVRDLWSASHRRRSSGRHRPVLSKVEHRIKEVHDTKNTLQKARLLIGPLLILTLSLAACKSPATEPPPTPTAVSQTTLTVSGSGTATSILNGIKPAFEADVPGYTLNVLPGSGTGGGVKGVIQGVLDVAAMARPPKDAEAAEGVEFVEFGQSGVAVYTHPDVGVTNLTAAQVVAIFLGQVTNWSEVGGSRMDIVLYVRDEGESSTKALRKAILGDTSFPETVHVLTSQADMQAAVAETRGAVGFGSWPSALAAETDVRAIVLDGVAPGDSTYPMVTPVGIGYLRDRQADVQPLIDWLLSERGQAALAEFDVVIKTQ